MFYLHKLHHGDRVEEVKATKSVQPVGGAGNVSDGQRGRVAGKYCVSRKNTAHEFFHKGSVCWSTNGKVLTPVPPCQADQKYPV